MKRSGSQKIISASALKKTFCLLVSMFIVASLFSISSVFAFADREAYDFGSCGKKLSWNYYEDGILEITGSGNMTNFNIAGGNEPMYYVYCEDIVGISLGQGITSIGNYAFADCTNLQGGIYLPESVTRIGIGAFSGCASIENITIHEEVFEICDDAFENCTSLNRIYYYGTQEQWEIIEKGNNDFSGVEIIYDYFFCLHENTKKYDAIPPSCNKDGVTESEICLDCNTWLVECEIIPMSGHKYISEITAQPTHLMEGVETFTCVCGDSYTKPIEKLSAHTYTEEITTKPTHKETGVKTFSCLCGDSYTEIIDKIPHSYSKVVTAPTCTSKGYTTYTCECGDNYVGDYTDKKGHSYTSKITTQPTHLQEGIETFTCVCGDSYTKPIAKLSAHTYTEEITTKPTHKETGVKTFSCVCGDSYTEIIDKIPHSYSKVVTAPTCLSKGYTTYTCECGDSYTSDYVDETTHSYTSTVVNPTCTQSGYITVSCTICDDANTEVLPATGHNFDGSECSDCDYDKSETCLCNCHKSGLKGFLWKIINILNKLFRRNQFCTCGVNHY